MNNQMQQMLNGVEFTDTQFKIFSDFLRERMAQDNMWKKPQDHSQFTWLVILMEEIGEASEALLKYKYENDRLGCSIKYRKELIQAGAMIMAMLEDMMTEETHWKVKI